MFSFIKISIGMKFVFCGISLNNKWFAIAFIES